MENASLTNISSHYILRQIFSQLEFNHFFSLIKYNKQLQNRLEINFKNKIHENKYFERRQKNELTDSKREGFECLCGSITFAIHYVYFIFHYLINIPLNIKLNADSNKSIDKYWTIINNLFFKIFSLFFHIFSALVLYHVILYFRQEFLYRKIIFIILTIFVIYIHCWYEIGLIQKIKLTFSFGLNGKWMIFFDGIYALINLTFIITAFRFLYLYFGSKTFPVYIISFIIVSYKDIKINEYKFKEDFKYCDNKRKLIDSKANDFRVEYTEDDLELIKDINYCRLENNLTELIYNKKIPDFIIKGSTELFLASNDIIKMSNTKYVLIFNNDIDFESLTENKNIMNILMKPFFNAINIIQQGNTKFITVYEDFYESYYNAIRIKDNFESENSILKVHLIK